MEMTPAIREYVEKRVSSLEKFIPDNKDLLLAEVEVGTTTNHHKTGDIFRAELNLSTGGKNIYAEAEKDDLYSAIDEMRDIAERECVSRKGKRETLAKRGASQIKKMLRW